MLNHIQIANYEKLKSLIIIKNDLLVYLYIKQSFATCFW